MAWQKKQRVDSTSAPYGHPSEQNMHPHHNPQHRQQLMQGSGLGNITPPRLMQQSGMPQHHPQITDLEEIHEQQTEENFEGEGQQANVEYILAKQYKSLRTGNVLGFPAFNAAKEILGFYRESSMKVGIGHFTPISRHKDEFGPSELEQATRILEDAIAKKSQAVHAMKDWGSLYSLIDHALVYDWSKDLGEGNDELPPEASPTAFD
uniref:Uncharacterized protein n=1 Tax=Helicotheca tamesis TaxID=374047 RepID=A0A7S2MLS8_9STRA|mmetsp:Transcript_17962/g.24737  ORF Transcript_17962/g.24737 Transcript_17962/m.24737 type:complete len:207 (+) Transcript_17962:1009-1629(+)